MIYYTTNWTCVRMGAKGPRESVLSFVWSMPTPFRVALLIAFSDAQCLDLCEVFVRDERIREHRLLLANTQKHLSTPQRFTIALWLLC